MQSSPTPICRHTKTNGRRCQSPAMGTSAFCYHHQKLRRTRPRTISAGPGLSTNVLHPLRNAQNICQAAGMLLNAIASKRVPLKHANLMIRALNLASQFQLNAERRGSRAESRS